MADRELWERRDIETDPAWAAFVVYRDMGPQRSTAKTARSLGKSKTQMDQWSSKHGWVARVHAYDMHLDELARTAHEHELVEWRKQQTRLGGKLLDLAEIGAHQILKAVKREQNPKKLTSAEIEKLAKTGHTLKRAGHGEPDAVTETRSGDAESALEREIQLLLSDPDTRKDLDRAGSRARGTEVKPRSAGRKPKPKPKRRKKVAKK